MIGIQIGANARINAGRLAAGRFNLLILAGQPVHIGGRPAQIGNMAGKIGRSIADRFDFADDRIFRTALDYSAFMFGDRTEGAAAETAAHDVDRMLDHFESGNIGVAVGLVRQARIGQVEDAVHFLVVNGIGGGLTQTDASRVAESKAGHCRDWFRRA